MEEMNSLFAHSKYTTNADASSIIKRFVQGNCNPYEWDDFESIPEENHEVDIAIKLCLYFASVFPARSNHEYCGAEADKYFFAIAIALDKGYFHNIQYEEIINSLKMKKIPAEISNMLSSIINTTTF